MIISCVLLNYNDAKETIAAITRAQNISEIKYIVVVDNCSPNGSYSLLKGYSSENVIVIETDHNGGYGYGNNIGLLKSKELGATHAIIANPDVVFDKDCVKGLVDIFEKYPQCAVAAPCTYFRGKPCFSKLPSFKEVLLESSSIHNHLMGRFTEYTDINADSFGIQVCDEVVGAMLAIDINKIELPVYDERFFLYCEEWVLGTKVKKLGYKTMVNTNVTYEHKISHSIDQKYQGFYTKRKLSNRSKLLFVKYYLHVNIFKQVIAKIFLSLTLIEAVMLDTMHKLHK